MGFVVKVPKNAEVERVASKESYRGLDCVRVEVDGDDARLVATNTRVLAVVPVVAEVDAEGKDAGPVYLPSKAFAELRRKVSNKETGRDVEFRGDGARWFTPHGSQAAQTLRAEQVRFPEHYESIVPRKCPEGRQRFTFRVNPEYLWEAARAIGAHKPDAKNGFQLVTISVDVHPTEGVTTPLLIESVEHPERFAVVMPAPTFKAR